MKRKIKKAISLLLAVLMLLGTIPMSFAHDHGEIIESYACSGHSFCDFSWNLYADGTLIANGSEEYTNAIRSHVIVAEKTVKKVIISDTVTMLRASAFARLNELTAIEVSDTHPTLTTVDGVLFNKDCSELICYPRGKAAATYVIPQTVNSIYDGTFCYAQLDYIVIPENVDMIGREAFYHSALSRVDFVSEKRNLFIHAAAFEGCKNLTEINLNAQALYGISYLAFSDSAFFIDETNWENGVLYINDILLYSKKNEMPDDYEIKAGTRVIADFAMQGSFDVESGEYVRLDVGVPESVDNFGTFSLAYDENSDDFYRIGRFHPTFTESYANEVIALLNEWMEKFNGGFSLEGLKAMPDELLYLEMQYGDYIQSIQLSFFVEEGLRKLYWFKDVKGFADDATTLYVPTFSVLPTYIDGYILDEDFEWLGRFSPLSETNTVASIVHFYADNEMELQESLKREKTLTFINPDCYINDSFETIWSGYTICGYTGSTAYDYAMKYNRKFVDISNCSHSAKVEQFALDASCSREGYSGDIYCQYCGELLEEGKIIPRSEEHFFGEWENVSNPSCTKDGVRKRICSSCKTEETEIYQVASGHSYYEKINPATCKYEGIRRTYCENCNYYTREDLPVTEHNDENKDFRCDYCGAYLQVTCGCNCHKDGFIGFFYKIISFFWRLFRINQVCGCGAYHY